MENPLWPPVREDMQALYLAAEAAGVGMDPALVAAWEALSAENDHLDQLALKYDAEEDALVLRDRLHMGERVDILAWMDKMVTYRDTSLDPVTREQLAEENTLIKRKADLKRRITDINAQRAQGLNPPTGSLEDDILRYSIDEADFLRRVSEQKLLIKKYETERAQQNAQSAAWDRERATLVRDFETFNERVTRLFNQPVLRWEGDVQAFAARQDAERQRLEVVLRDKYGEDKKIAKAQPGINPLSEPRILLEPLKTPHRLVYNGAVRLTKEVRENPGAAGDVAATLILLSAAIHPEIHLGAAAASIILGGYLVKSVPEGALMANARRDAENMERNRAIPYTITKIDAARRAYDDRVARGEMTAEERRAKMSELSREMVAALPGGETSDGQLADNLLSPESAFAVATTFGAWGAGKAAQAVAAPFLVPQMAKFFGASSKKGLQATKDFISWGGFKAGQHTVKGSPSAQDRNHLLSPRGTP